MKESQIVLGSDGRVLMATEDLPSRLVGALMEECDALTPQVRQAGAALLVRLRGCADSAVTDTVVLDETGQRVQLIVVEAIGVRRALTDVAALLRSKLDVLSFQAAAANVALDVDAGDEGLPLVFLDPEKVAWAVTTLVGNALRYVVEGSRRPIAGRIRVRIRHEPQASTVTIDVQDDGPGIPADTASRVFRRDGLNVRGAGLALLLIADVVAAHGGKVAVESSTDPRAHGTSIRLTLPAG